MNDPYYPIFWAIDQILTLFLIVMVVRIVLSWLLAFQVVNPRNQFVWQVNRTAQALTDPVMRPVQRVIPPMGGMDLSPIVIFLLIYVIQMYLWQLYHGDPLTGQSAFRLDGEDVVLTVRVTPGARKVAIEPMVIGADGKAYGRIRVRAKAQDGAANADVIETLAKAIGCPKSALDIESGQTARIKTIRIRGAATATMNKLQEIFAP